VRNKTQEIEKLEKRERRLSRTESRVAVLAQMQKRLITQSYPRLVVLLIVALSGLGAFLFSAVTLEFGFTQMGLRYFGATLVGYLTFLLLLRGWIAYERRDWHIDGDLPDLGSRDGEPAKDALFGGGRSGGGGSAGSWHPSHGFDTGIDLDLDIGELWLVVVAGICALGGLIAILYVVYAAPVLLAEVALDAALVAGLYRKLRQEDARHWLTSAIRHTWAPALVAGLFLIVAGVAIQWALPDARSIGDVWRQIR
jgi:hypothetical protein